jgi:hypothetical protein
VRGITTSEAKRRIQWDMGKIRVLGRVGGSIGKKCLEVIGITAIREKRGI